MLKKTTRGMTAGMTRRGVGFAVAGGGAGYDTDAQAYITLVEAADSQSLETGVKDAINAFVVGCKSDGIWDAIKASCILAGARTLTGALQPLVGTAPQPYNFVSGDYDRKLGLEGDGATKYLDSNRADDASPQNDRHFAMYVTTADATDNIYMGAYDGSNAVTQRFISSGNTSWRLSGTTFYNVNSSNPTGFAGASRASSASFQIRQASTDYTASVSSATPSTTNFGVFCRLDSGTTPTSPSDGRLSFYSIGEALDLALLDTRVTSLMAQLAFAINTGLSPVGYSSETIDYVNAGYAAGGTLA